MILTLQFVIVLMVREFQSKLETKLQTGPRVPTLDLEVRVSIHKNNSDLLFQ